MRLFEHHGPFVVQLIGGEQDLECRVREVAAQHCGGIGMARTPAAHKRVAVELALTVDRARRQRLVDQDPKWLTRDGLVERVGVAR